MRGMKGFAKWIYVRLLLASALRNAVAVRLYSPTHVDQVRRAVRLPQVIVCTEGIDWESIQTWGAADTRQASLNSNLPRPRFG